MFGHKVDESDVLRLQSVRIEVVAAPLGVHVHCDPVFSRSIGVVGVAHDRGRVRVDDDIRQRVFGNDVVHVCGTSAGRAIAGAISRPSASSSSLVVVDDVATFVDLEHRLGFAVDDHVHGLREWRRKVYLDAQVTLLHQVEAAAVARIRC